jgi:hypothetical protein
VTRDQEIEVDSAMGFEIDNGASKLMPVVVREWGFVSVRIMNNSLYI